MKQLRVVLTIALVSMLLPVEAADDKSAKPYPLQTCFISDEKIGSMGKPVVFVYEGQEVKLCCKDCQKTFDKDPAAAMKKLAAAVKSK